MSEQDNTRLVQEVYDNFNAGNLEALLGALADDIEWVLPDIPKVPFSGARRGRDSVAAFFSAVAEHQEPKSFDVQGIIAQGDRAVAFGHYAWHVKSTGRDFEGDFAHIFTVEAGRITRFHEYTDTAAATAAY